MSAMRFNSSNPDPWTMPRPPLDPSQRLRKHGRIQPMEGESRSFLDLFRWR